MTDQDQGPAEVEPAVPPTVGSLHDLVGELIAAVEEARPVPLSSTVRVDRDELLGLLHRLQDELPEELRAARWMVREREAFIARTNEQAKTIVERARARAAELVSESSIIAEAVEEANVLVRRAEGDARRIRLEAEDYAEARLEEVDQLFDRLLREVREARARLHESRPAPPPVPD